jgi:Ca2+-binding EF-hand superfamily protein
MDGDKSGRLTAGEFSKVVEDLELELDDVAIGRAFRKVDEEQRGFLDFDGFCRAVRAIPFFKNTSRDL